MTGREMVLCAAAGALIAVLVVGDRKSASELQKRLDRSEAAADSARLQTARQHAAYIVASRNAAHDLATSQHTTDSVITTLPSQFKPKVQVAVDSTHDTVRVVCAPLAAFQAWQANIQRQVVAERDRWQTRLDVSTNYIAELQRDNHHLDSLLTDAQKTAQDAINHDTPWNLSIQIGYSLATRQPDLNLGLSRRLIHLPRLPFLP